MSAGDIALHTTKLSGHPHRMELLLRMRGMPFEFVDTSAEVRGSPECARPNPLGQVPVLRDGDLAHADSNAILTLPGFIPMPPSAIPEGTAR